jgi:hypothetical protein
LDAPRGSKKNGDVIRAVDSDPPNPKFELPTTETDLEVIDEQ